jgi:YHS domain-containing protein
MFVDPNTSPKSEYEGQTYYFCSLEDKAKFDKDPGNYSSQAP